MKKIIGLCLLVFSIVIFAGFTPNPPDQLSASKQVVCVADIGIDSGLILYPSVSTDTDLVFEELDNDMDITLTGDVISPSDRRYIYLDDRLCGIINDPLTGTNATENNLLPYVDFGKEGRIGLVETRARSWVRQDLTVNDNNRVNLDSGYEWPFIRNPGC
ncbi:MAG: hypothetical protein HUU10_04215 [Bacteroidetes bacterium]|nr:hypothetical protein [Bacteroidota bacterium]